MVAINSSGYNTPNSDVDSILPVHPTATRRPHYITVQSNNTAYTDEHITAKFVNRGAHVVNNGDGQYVVQPTAQTYEFQTKRNVSKTGWVLL